MDRPKDILSSMYGVCVGDLMDKEKFVKGIQECDLNGGKIGNCPYKGIIDLLKDREAETGHWIYKEFDDMFLCSCCGNYSVSNVYPHCHWCGARMKGREFEDG